MEPRWETVWKMCKWWVAVLWRCQVWFGCLESSRSENCQLCSSSWNCSISCALLHARCDEILSLCFPTLHWVSSAICKYYKYYHLGNLLTGKAGQPSFGRLFQYPNFETQNSLANKSFFQVSSILHFILIIHVYVCVHRDLIIINFYSTSRLIGLKCIGTAKQLVPFSSLVQMLTRLVILIMASKPCTSLIKKRVHLLFLVGSIQ